MFGRSLPITITLAITAINGPANYYSRRVNILRWGDAEAGRGDSGDCPETGSAQCAIICTPMENLPFALYTVQCILYKTIPLHIPLYCTATPCCKGKLSHFPFPDASPPLPGGIFYWRPASPWSWSTYMMVMAADYSMYAINTISATLKGTSPVHMWN